MILYVLALVVAILLIAKAGGVFVDSSCTIARGLGVSRAVIGLTIVSFATTLPEFATSTMAVGLGEVGMAYGNAVGSCITNIGLILGVTMMISTIMIRRHRLGEGAVMLGLGSLVTIMTLDGNLNRYEALPLILSLVLFFWFILRREKRNNRRKERLGLKKPATFFVLGAIGVIVGSRLLVYSGVGIASELGVSSAIIGLTLVAFGTSLPELATAVISVSKKVAELSLGNIIGANILNLGWVLGVAGVMSPLTVDFHTMLFSNLMMIALMAVLLVFMTTHRKSTRWGGVLLLGLYIGYFFWLVLGL